MTDNQELELTTETFYNLQNVYEVLLELQEGTFLIEDLIITIEKLFSDFTKEEKTNLAVKVLKISAILNEC